MYGKKYPASRISKLSHVSNGLRADLPVESAFFMKCITCENIKKANQIRELLGQKNKSMVHLQLVYEYGILRGM